jgi:hypothetical protein
MTQDKTQFNFRMDSSLAEWLKQRAAMNRRSITAELSLIIEGERERHIQDNKKADCTVESNQTASETAI